MNYEKAPAHWPDELVEADRLAQNLAMYCDAHGLTIACCIIPTSRLTAAENLAKSKLFTSATRAPRSVILLGNVNAAMKSLVEKVMLASGQPPRGMP